MTNYIPLQKKIIVGQLDSFLSKPMRENILTTKIKRSLGAVANLFVSSNSVKSLVRIEQCATL